MADKPDEMGGDDLYGTDADMPKHEGDESEEMEHSDSEEAILPKSILAGKEFKVGEEVVLKITAMHDDRISVQYAPAKENSEGEGDDGGMEDADKAQMPSGMAGGGGGASESMYD